MTSQRGSVYGRWLALGWREGPPGEFWGCEDISKSLRKNFRVYQGHSKGHGGREGFGDLGAMCETSPR